MSILDQLNEKLANASAALDESNKEVERIKRELKAAKDSRSEHQDTVNMLANNIRELRDGEFQPGLFDGEAEEADSS